MTTWYIGSNLETQELYLVLRDFVLMAYALGQKVTHKPMSPCHAIMTLLKKELQKVDAGADVALTAREYIV